MIIKIDTATGNMTCDLYPVLVTYCHEHRKLNVFRLSDGERLMYKEFHNEIINFAAECRWIGKAVGADKYQEL